MASNKQTKSALNSMKMQAASEVGVALNANGYNGELTSKQAGSIGGQMVKDMVPELQRLPISLLRSLRPELLYL